MEGDSIEFMVRLGEIKFFGSPWITGVLCVEQKRNDENDPRPWENVMVPCTSWTMTCCRAEGCWRVLSWPCERCSHGSLTLTWHLMLWSVSLKLIDVFLKRSSALFSQIVHVSVASFFQFDDWSSLRFSQQYLQLLAQEVEESLEESGSLSVADLASNPVAKKGRPTKVQKSLFFFRRMFAGFVSCFF